MIWGVVFKSQLRLWKYKWFLLFANSGFTLVAESLG